ncbi:MAG: hypothetical protein AAF603_09650 [Pseudomonadota bacterium]
MTVRKLPIAETALESLIFGLKNVGTALRLGWFSVLLFIGLWGVAGAVMASAISAETWQNWIDLSQTPPDQLGPEVFSLSSIDMREGGIIARSTLASLLVFASFFVFTPVAVVLSQIASGDRPAPKGVIYWRWGGREWRVIATLFIYMFTILFVMTALTLFSTIMAVSIGNSGDITLSWLPALISIVIFCTTTWVYLRLILVVPAAALENRMNFIEAVGATGGNVFRLFGSFLLLMVLFFFVFIAATLVIFVLSFSFQIALTQTGTATPVGQSIGFLSALLIFLFFGFLIVASQLTSIAWFAKSWAALRQQD